jgi:lauroyl/myristoyl acyltransferase
MLVTLFRLLARVPLPWMHRLGVGFGWLVWWTSPDYRRRFKANAEAAGFTPAQYRPAIGAAGAMPSQRAMCGSTLSPRKAWMARLMEGSRDRAGLQTVPTSVTGVRSLIRALRSGGYTGVLPDQVPPLGQGVWAPFFGRPAYTMTLLPRLAQQTGARVFLGVCERLPRGAGDAIRCEPFDGTAMSDPKATPEAAAGAMNQGIERLIRRLPQQYVWDYARHKQPKGEPKEAA